MQRENPAKYEILSANWVHYKIISANKIVIYPKKFAAICNKDITDALYFCFPHLVIE